MKTFSLRVIGQMPIHAGSTAHMHQKATNTRLKSSRVFVKELSEIPLQTVQQEYLLLHPTDAVRHR